MTTGTLYLSGIGAWVPDRQDAVEALATGQYTVQAAQTDQLTSACVEPKLTPAEMAAEAGREALAMAGADASSVRAVLHSYIEDQGPRYWDAAPYVALHTVGASVPAYDVRQSCNGALCCMELAQGLLRVDHPDSVLITTGDRFDQPGVNRWAGDQSVFGDGGAAMVLNRQAGFARVASIHTRSDNSLEGECRGVDFATVRDEDIDFDGRRQHFYTNGVPMLETYARLEAVIHAVLRATLDEAAVSAKDLAWVVPVVTTQWRTLTQLDRFLGLPVDRSTWFFGRTTGHVGSGDQILGLHHLLHTDRLSTGDKVLLLGGGTGFTMTAAVLEILSVP